MDDTAHTLCFDSKDQKQTDVEFHFEVEVLMKGKAKSDFCPTGVCAAFAGPKCTSGPSADEYFAGCNKLIWNVTSRSNSNELDTCRCK